MGIIEVDILILGAGSAGLACALECQDLGRVAVLAKTDLTQSASMWAQGGIAGVLPGQADRIEAHVQDTLGAGAGLCHPESVQQILSGAPEAIDRLLRWGAHFDRDDDGWHLTREGGHSARRVLHTADHTGRSITQALLDQVARNPDIQVLPEHQAGQLEIHDGRCTGAWVRHPEGGWELWRARVVVLATGGLGQIYRHTSNPAGATGDGLALAWLAGAELANLEFVQFHPTTLYDPGHPAFLLSEALRGEGAVLCLPDGSRFAQNYDPRAELAPRDIVSRAIYREMAAHGLQHVTLDISQRPATQIRSHFPSIYAHCLARGHDLAKGPVPVVPAAHYSCGGVRSDTQGRTNILGLYAIGEVACSGLHGANRLASNSLLECAVMAHGVYLDLAGKAALPARHQQAPCPPVFIPADQDYAQQSDDLRALLWDQVGILRSQAGLQTAVEQLTTWAEAFPMHGLPSTPATLTWRNLLLTATAVARGALWRQESRGCHADADFPERHAQARDLLQRQDWDQPRWQALPDTKIPANDATPDRQDP